MLSDKLDLDLLVLLAISNAILVVSIKNDRVEEILHVLRNTEYQLVTINHFNQEVLLKVDLSLVKRKDLKLPILNSVAAGA